MSMQHTSYVIDNLYFMLRFLSLQQYLFHKKYGISQPYTNKILLSINTSKFLKGREHKND